MKKAIILIIFGFLGILLFAPVFAQNAPEIPQNLQEAQLQGKTAINAIPSILKHLWEEFIGYCRLFLGWLIRLFNSYMKTPLLNFWNKEVEIRKPGIEREFQKEKQEIKNDIPQTTKTLWEKFKELIK